MDKTTFRGGTSEISPQTAVVGAFTAAPGGHVAVLQPFWPKDGGRLVDGAEGPLPLLPQLGSQQDNL